MNDENTSLDTWQVDEHFDEGFDFGEGETQRYNPLKTIATKRLNKKIISFIFASVTSVAIVLFIIGYRIYSVKLLDSANELNTSTLITKPTSAATLSSATILKNVAEKSEEIEKQHDEFIRGFSNVRPSAATTSTHVLAETTSVTVSVPMPAPSPAVIIPTVLKVPEAEKKSLLQEPGIVNLERLDKLNNQINSILGQVKYLDIYSREVSDSLNKLNKAISAINNRLLALINTHSALSKDVGTVKSEMAEVKEIVKGSGLNINTAYLSKTKQDSPAMQSPAVIAEPEYKVHAVIPGRAWLKSTKGQVVTVTEGDSIGSYGRILVIDAPNSVVLTSSGVAFH